jgi:hypothetical protein
MGIECPQDWFIVKSRLRLLYASGSMPQESVKAALLSVRVESAAEFRVEFTLSSIWAERGGPENSNVVGYATEFTKSPRHSSIV